MKENDERWGAFPDIERVRNRLGPEVVDDNTLSDSLASDMNRLARADKPVENKENEIKDHHAPLPYASIHPDFLMPKIVKFFSDRFHDELTRVGPEFLQAEYSGRNNACPVKQNFDNGLEKRLRKELYRRDLLIDTFRITHPNFCVESGNSEEPSYPFFDFSVEAHFNTDPHSDPGCSILVGCSTYVDYNQKSLEKIFHYACHYEAMKQVIRDALGACNRSIEQGQVVDRLLNYITPFKLAEPVLHVRPPSEKLGILAYDISACLDISKTATRLVFRDNTGFIHTALKRIYEEDTVRRLLAVFNRNNDAGVDAANDRDEHDFEKEEDGLDSSAKSPEDHRYVTTLVRNY